MPDPSQTSPLGPLSPEEEARRAELMAATKDAREVTEASPKYQIPNSGGAPAPAGFSVEQFEQFAQLNAEKTRLSAELKSVRDQMEAMQEPLMEQLTNSGQSKINLDSGFLIYPKTDVFVKAGKPGVAADEDDWNAACDVLEQLGLGEFSKRRFLIPTLKSYVGQLKKDAEAEGREFESLDELLPPELAAVISIDTATKLQAKKG